MSSRLRTFCLAALLAFAGTAQAQIALSDAEDLARRSGLWEQLKGVGAQVEISMQQLLAQASRPPSATERARVRQVIHEAYAVDRLRARSTGTIAAGVPAGNLPALRQWFASPVGLAMTRAEEAASAHPDQAAMLREGALLLQALPAERQQALAELAAAFRAADALVQMTINTAVAAQIGAASALPDAPRPSAAQIRAQLEAQRPRMLQAFQAVSLASFAAAYAQVSTEDLRAYAAFIRSPAGRQFSDLAMQALDAALAEAAGEMGRRLPGTRDRSNT